MAVPQNNQYQETYENMGKFVCRHIISSDGKKTNTRIPAKMSSSINDDDDQSIFDYSFLRLKEKSLVPSSIVVPTVDLFSGCGCLSLGAMEALSALGQKFMPLLAIDKDSDALAVYNENFKPSKVFPDDICALVDGAIGDKETDNEKFLRMNYLGNISPALVLAGPPCQGYSSLNNFHRQSDNRNRLYERVARFVEIFEPTHVLIENVPTVLHSPDDVVAHTIALMESKGYFVDNAVIDLACLGVPQVRKRHVVIASRKYKVCIKSTIEKHRVKRRRTFEWAAADLKNESSDGLLNRPTKHSEDNKQRMEYLQINNLYDLPNEQRPICHQKEHGYKSMYGRIRPNQPAQTITSGFTSPGQGRYIHPTEIRTITPHEAARLQMIPDYFDFSKARSRRALALMIGNAAPMKLSYVFCIELFN